MFPVFRSSLINVSIFHIGGWILSRQTSYILLANDMREDLEDPISVNFSVSSGQRWVLSGGRCSAPEE